MNVSGLLQIANAAKLLDAKLTTLGLWNLLARERAKIPQAYLTLGKDAGSTKESLRLLSRALLGDENFVPSQAVMQRHILHLLVTVIQGTQDFNIRLEFVKGPSSKPTQIHRETNISNSPHSITNQCTTHQRLYQIYILSHATFGGGDGYQTSYSQSSLT